MIQTSDSDAPPGKDQPQELTVVAIGASAGGLEALEHFFDNTPVDSGMAFVVVQHLSPDFKSLMDELLARHTTMNIHRAENGMLVESNSIYLIPPKKNMGLSQGRLTLSEQDHSQGLNMPIDVFFSSMARQKDIRKVAVVLSGTGSDGSRGIVDVSEAGGLVAAQSSDSAAFDGMPKSAMDTNRVQVVASPWELPNKILQCLRDPSQVSSGTSSELPVKIPAGEELNAILALFRRRYQVDFTHYREITIQRRVERRVQLVRCRDLADYMQLLREDNTELETLYRDLLVEVTQFFRDPQAFERLKRDVIPQILAKAQNTREEVRAWVAGCATGEEAYSIAMLLDQCAIDAGLSPTIKVFATDVHRSSLEAGSAGVYSMESLSNLPEHMRRKYFSLNGSLYHVTPALRKLVIFAPHNLTNDPPFTRMDLISCRNVLIYLKPDVQKRVLSLFHFGLRLDGFLLLGSSESLGDLSHEFESVDQHWRIFKKLRDVRLRETGVVPMSPPLASNSIVTPQQTPLVGIGRSAPANHWNLLAEELLDRYVPPSVVLNAQQEIVHSFGNAREYFKQPKGRATLEILKMATGDLRMALSTALHRAARGGKPVALQGVRAEVGDKQVMLRITVEDYKLKGTALKLVCLEETSERKAKEEPNATQFRADDQAASRIIELEQELEFKTESLRSTVEELESSNEELQSTNEELVASNEELQSTNEELHSVNEELYTVNAEHQRKIDELTTLTADMDNLIRSTEIATIFLDRKLCIRRFTPSITRVFNIIEQDVGRPIEQFAYHFESPDWIEQARDVISTGDAQQTEITLRDQSATYLKRVSPFKTASDEIAGVVITFTDISEVARTKELEERQLHLERVNHDLQEFVYAVSHDMQTPMRHLRDALRRLREATTETKSPSGAELQAFDREIRRLEEMLAALLNYSRVNTRGKTPANVNSQQIVDEIVNEFDASIRSRNAHVKVGSLPIIPADQAQFRSLMWHLVDNALKYSDRPPRIEIQCQDQVEKWDFTIRDEGIGILPQHCEIIFVIFRRLGFKKDVEGQGVGLALCKRIAERHHAGIWAEPNDSDGMTVHIHWPKLPSLES